MKVQLRRRVWVIDLIGMLVGAGLLGHLVADQIVNMLWWTPSEYAPPPSRGAGKEAAADAVSGARLARWSSSVAARPIGVHHYEIERSFIDDHLIADFARLRHPAQVIPASVDGQPAGYRIFGRLSYLDAIGLASGDLVLEANGFPLTHPGALLDAYAALRQTSEPWLVIERDGRRILLTYLIVNEL